MGEVEVPNRQVVRLVGGRVDTACPQGIAFGPRLLSLRHAHISFHDPIFKRISLDYRDVAWW